MQPTTATLLPSPMLDGFESISVNPESSASRRQRISMACQYCRHRKIRCCGAAPCRNCTRSGRVCEYTPVPEEVNRATREKKALSKAKPSTPATPSKPTLTHPTPSPMPAFSPYLIDGPTFDMPYTLPVPPPHVLPSGPRPSGHRRTSSAPSYESASWSIPPPAPMLNSPAQLESSAWMYNGWSAALPVPSIEVDTAPYTPTRAFPSVLEQTPLHAAYLSHTPAVSSPLVPQHYQMMSNPMPSVPTMPDTMSASIESEYSYNWSIPPYMAMPVAPSPYLLPPTPTTNKGLNIQTSGFALSTPPITPTTYYTPYSTPSLYSSASSSAGNSSTYTPSPPAYSPTLAPEPSSKKELFGLGLAMPIGAIEHDVFYTPPMQSGEYFSY